MESTSPAVNACLFSPCGTYLISGTALGKLHVWKFTQAAEGGDEEGGGLLPSRVAELQAHTVGCAIYALAFAETKSGLLLLSGADEEICGWNWDAILKAGSTMPNAPPSVPNPPRSPSASARAFCVARRQRSPEPRYGWQRRATGSTKINFLSSQRSVAYRHAS